MNERNLIPFTERSESEVRELNSKGGVNSGKTRRKKKLFKQLMTSYLEMDETDVSTWNELSEAGFEPEDISNKAVIVKRLADRAKTGDTNAGKLVLEISGEDIKHEELTLKKKELKLKEKSMQKETGTAVYGGIPASAVAPQFAGVLFDISEQEHSEYVFPGGRGSTKSSFIGLNIIDLLEKNPEIHACVLRAVANTLKDSVYAQIQWAISTLGLDDEYTFTKSPLEITKNSTQQKIFFRGADDPNKIKSIKAPFGHIGILWFEELDQFAGEESVRKIEQSVIRGGDKAYVFKSFNPPKSAMNWANKYIKIPRDDRLVTESTYLTVPKKWLGKKFIDDAEFLKATNPKAYENEYLGSANGTGGNVFDNVQIRAITDEELSQFERIYRGVDWGWYPDPYAYTACAYDPARLTLYIFDEYRCNKQSNKKTADELLKNHSVTYNDVIICDSAETKSTEDYRSYGLRARNAEKGPGSVDYSMKWLQSLNAIVIDNKRCPETAKEFLEYEYERDKEGNVITGYPDKNNHSIDSVRYATNDIWKKRGQ